MKKSWIPGNPFALFPFSKGEKLNFPTSFLISYERHAIMLYLQYLKENQSRRIETILMPDFMCHEVVKTFRENQYNVVFYPLDQDLSVDLEEVEKLVKAFGSRNSAAMIYHPYGKMIKNRNEVCLFFKRNGILILEDMAHLPYPYDFDSAHQLFDARFYSLRKIYGVPYGAAVCVQDSAEDFEKFICTQKKLIHDKGSFKLFSWYMRQFVKKSIVRLSIPFQQSYRDLSQEPLENYQLGFNFIKKIISQDEYQRVIHHRRENFKYYAEHFDVFENWARPLMFDCHKDIPYQLLLFLKEGFDPVSVVSCFRKNGVAAVLGMALSESVLKDLPQSHIYHRQIALPLHQDISPREIERIICVCRSFKNNEGKV